MRLPALDWRARVGTLRAGLELDESAEAIAKLREVVAVPTQRMAIGGAAGLHETSGRIHRL